MADTATHLPEKADAAADVEKKAAAIAEIVRSAKHLIVFTGAGISTSCGIPDFRGPTGVWTMRDLGKKAPSGTPVGLARPSITHMAIRQLVDAGFVKAAVSQNTDGLHARSGIPLDRLWEVHGNSYKVTCWKCGYHHLLKQPVRAAKDVRKAGGSCAACLKRVPHFCHCTMFACPTCGPTTPLRDTIIHFGENLDEAVIDGATTAGDVADACLALGSSLTVHPAAGIPQSVADRGGKLVIINKQDTPLDGSAAVRVWSDLDAVMTRVLALLGVEIPPFDEAAWLTAHEGQGKLALTPDGERAMAAAAAAAKPVAGVGAGTASARGGASATARAPAAAAAAAGSRTAARSGASSATSATATATASASPRVAAAAPTAGSAVATAAAARGARKPAATPTGAAGASVGRAGGLLTAAALAASRDAVAGLATSIAALGVTDAAAPARPPAAAPAAAAGRR